VFRRLGIFAIAFVVVIAGGIAFAQMGEYLPSSGDTSEAAALETSSFLPEVTDTTEGTAEEPAEEPATTTTVVDEPEGDKEEPPASKDEPVEEEDTPDTTLPEEVVDTDPPDLIITSPDDGATVSTRELKFEGEVEPGATVKAAGYWADVTDDGYWSIVLILEPGGNLATFRAYDAAGNVSEATVKVFYEAPEGEHAFTANQQYKTSAANPPYDVFYGTGRPGATIKATSEFGSGSTTVNEKGKWEMKVTFPDAPYYEWFAVRVSDSDGHSKTFEFKSKFNPDATYDFTINQHYGVNSNPWEKFSGTATPGTVIGAYSEYGSAETVAEGGEFFLKVHFEGLTPGQTIAIVVETSEGDRRTFEFRYEPASIEFSAYQQYGSCSESPPYDVFHGTATPGATVWAESPYGGGTTVAGDLGKWDLKVFFEGAPVGEPFTVTIGDSEGHSKSFTFTRLDSK
jgi:hypothetical protein